MIPFCLILLVNSLIAFAHELSGPIRKFLTKPSKKELAVRSEIAELEGELNKIDMFANYIEYVTLQRKISKLHQQLLVTSKGSLMNGIIGFAVGYILQFFLSFFLIIISIYYRYTPIIVFQENFNFSPFGTMIGYPTGINNAISVPFWIFVTNFSLRSLANFIRS